MNLIPRFFPCTGLSGFVLPDYYMMLQLYQIRSQKTNDSKRDCNLDSELVEYEKETIQVARMTTTMCLMDV